MGVGAIVMLVVLAALTLMRTDRHLSEDDLAGAVAAGIVFAVDVAILVAGNPWVWAGFVLLGTAKLIFWPSPATADAAARHPVWAHNLNIASSVVFSGCVFALFQWLR